MADFFDRLLAKTAPAPAPHTADADGVTSVAARPRLPHPFERPTTVGDLDWDQQAPAESDYPRRGNTMELRREPTSGGQGAVSALPRSDDHAAIPQRPDAGLTADRLLSPLSGRPAAAEQPLPRLNPPTLPIAASQTSARLAPQTGPSDSGRDASILGSPADRASATALPAARHASARPAPTPPPSPSARPAERGTAPARRAAAAAPQPPSVTVRIGRLEVRAATPPPAGPASFRPDRRTREPALKLDEYLAREGGRR